MMKYSKNLKGGSISFNTAVPEKRLVRAQKWLGWKVADDMSQYVPFGETGTLSGRPFTHPAALDDGVVIWDAVQARNLFNGFVMVGTESNKVWANKGERKKVTDRRYQFNTLYHPLATSKWTVEGVRNHKDEWHRGLQRFIEGRV